MLALVISTVAVWILSCTVIGVFAVEGALHLPRLAVTAEKRDRATAIADREGAIFSDAMGRDMKPAQYPYNMRDAIEHYVDLLLNAIGVKPAKPARGRTA